MYAGFSAAQAAIANNGSLAGAIGGAISGQGRSGFETNVITKLDNIESQLGSGGGGIPTQSGDATGAIAPALGQVGAVGNLAATSAIPTGGPLADTNATELSQQGLRSGGRPETGGFEPLAQAASTEIYGDQYERDMSLQNRTLI
tara:strand:- start:474 stop:908 length:435 start_codon:yes stop_codon:yes gene_type:complete